MTHACHINTITLAGLDQRTDINAIRELASHPLVEVAVLYSANPEGRNRYPSRQWIASTVERMSGAVAIHVCGSAALRQLADRQLDDIVGPVSRIQVNGALCEKTVAHLCDIYPLHTIITQYSSDNPDTLASVDVDRGNHAILVDASAGRGLLPPAWFAPVQLLSPAKPVGFAGGLGPRNLPEQLKRISSVAAPGAWVDMESSLRTNDDWFDAVAAAGAVDALARFVGMHAHPMVA